jgi:hypothetical protein
VSFACFIRALFAYIESWVEVANVFIADVALVVVGTGDKTSEEACYLPCEFG